jgi:hypothetical protein
MKRGKSLDNLSAATNSNDALFFDCHSTVLDRRS